MTSDLVVEHPELPFLRLLRASLRQSYDAFHAFCNTLGREWVFYNGYITKDALVLWLTWVDQFAMPLNKETARIIRDHEHLWPTLPAPLADFLNYHDNWVKNHEAWKAGKNPSYGFWAGRNFPQSINEFVYRESGGFSAST